jgi:negative regulator of flagellin synthesis FlgM
MSPIEIRPVRLAQPTDKTAATTPIRRADRVPEGEREVEVSRSPLLKPAPAPIDAERIETIRNAIGSGTYRLVPDQIADAMIAAAQASRNA